MDPGVPLAIEMRDERPQAVHTGHAVLLDAEGGILQQWGHDVSTYWRSAPKPLQAIPFARHMAALGLDTRHLALACASHSGEAGHLEIALETLAAAGLDESALRCAQHPAMTKHSVRAKDGQRAIHNNCSGKHGAMLAVCKQEGWDTSTYDARDHPLQREILGLVRQATGLETPTGGDGCGLPTFWAPISALARTYQWLDRHDVGRTCLDAMHEHPYLVAGRERFCTALMRAGPVIGKVGAAGVYVMLHRPTGQAAAIKMAAGTAKAAETVAAALATHQGWASGLDAFEKRPIEDCAGRERGTWQATL